MKITDYTPPFRWDEKNETILDAEGYLLCEAGENTGPMITLALNNEAERGKESNPDFKKELDAAYEAGRLSVSLSGNKEVSFETEYQLKEFRSEQKELFDENGSAKSMITHKEPMTRMLKLINQLEQELKNKL